MPRTSRTLASAMLLLCVTVTGCDSSAPTLPDPPVPSASATFTVPPLQLPEVPAGAACPVTAVRPWSGPGQTGQVLGEGPLYPVADYFRGDTELELRPDDRQPDGSYVKKVRWIGVGYSGPVLVRAARIDAPGSAGVTFSYTGEERDGGHYAELTRETNDLPATTTVAGPGCYAYQVDGTTFSRTIVFRAVSSGG